MPAQTLPTVESPDVKLLKGPLDGWASCTRFPGVFLRPGQVPQDEKRQDAQRTASNVRDDGSNSAQRACILGWTATRVFEVAIRRVEMSQRAVCRRVHLSRVFKLLISREVNVEINTGI